jgi:hypothetical protein
LLVPALLALTLSRTGVALPQVVNLAVLESDFQEYEALKYR